MARPARTSSWARDCGQPGGGVAAHHHRYRAPPHDSLATHLDQSPLLDADYFANLAVRAFYQDVSALGSRLLEPGLKSDRVSEHVGHGLASLARQVLKGSVRLLREIDVHTPYPRRLCNWSGCPTQI